MSTNYRWKDLTEDEKKRFVRLLKEDGHSDEAIGHFLRASKGQIVGFRHRKLTELTFGEKATKPRVDQARFVELLVSDEAPKAAETPRAEEVPVTEVKKDTELPHGGCRWPMPRARSLKEVPVCGKPTLPGKDVCEEHHEMILRIRRKGL